MMRVPLSPISLTMDGDTKTILSLTLSPVTTMIPTHRPRDVESLLTEKDAKERVVLYVY